MRTLAATLVSLAVTLGQSPGCTLFAPPEGQTSAQAQAEAEFELLAAAILAAQLAATYAYDDGQIDQQTWDRLVAPAFVRAQSLLSELAVAEQADRRSILRDQIRQLLRDVALAHSPPTGDPGR